MDIDLMKISKTYPMKNEEKNDKKPEPKKGINSEPSEEQQLEETDKPVTLEPGQKDEGIETEEVEGDDFKELDQDPIDDEEFDEHGSGDDSDFDDASKLSINSSTGTDENKEVSREQPSSIKGIEGSVDEKITNQENGIVNKKGQ